MKETNEIFEKVKEFCKAQLTDVTYNLWINPLEFLKMQDNVAHIFIKTDIQKKMMNEKYYRLLREGFSIILGFEVEIFLVSEEDIEKDPSLGVSKNTDTIIDSYSTSIDQSVFNAENNYTFDTFIVGSSNNFAYAACRAVANRQSGSYNPLFIYGPSGLGKTHLLMSIRNEIKRNSPDVKIVFVNGETFTNDLINAIQTENIAAFHNKYRNADILLVDDIQFIAGKERTQEEFFHTFNDLHQVGKQIVLVSDRPPKDIKTLEERMRNRFEWGLLSDVSAPDIETRIAIIRKKAEQLSISIPNDVIEFIANKIKNNIRQLEGAVKKIKAFKILTNSSPSILIAQNVVSEVLNENVPVKVTVDLVIEEVARTFNVTTEEIISSKRASNISTARQVVIYILREITDMSLSEIGNCIGGRDHSTMVYAINIAEKNISKDPSYKETVEDIIKNIRK
jgi:chromosomal replication initiator protein